MFYPLGENSEKPYGWVASTQPQPRQTRVSYEQITKKKSQLLLKKCPCKSWTNAFPSFIFRKEKSTAAAARSLRAKIVIVN